MSDDTISRQAAVEALDGEIEVTGKANAKAVLKSEQGQKKGKWIWKNKKSFCSGDCWWPPTGFEDSWNEKEGSWIEKELYCSECNFKNWGHYKFFNFCPNCGADMREESDNEVV